SRECAQGGGILRNDWDHRGGLAAIPCFPVGIEASASRLDEIGACPTEGVCRAADSRHLYHHAADAAVYGAEDEAVPSAIACPPYADTVAINARQVACECDRVAIVSNLLDGIDLLPRL